MEISHNEKEKKFFVVTGGKESVLEYEIVDKRTLNFYHTFVDPSLRNQGVAQELVVHALAYAKMKKYKVIPSCPYVASYIHRNPEYAGLVK